MEAAGQDTSEAAAKISYWNKRQDDFLQQTGFKRQQSREEIAGFTWKDQKAASEQATDRYNEWAKSIGVKNSIEDLAKYYDIKYNDSPRYELLQKYHFYVDRSTRQWIHHTLLVKPGTKLSDIKTIYSHQQAIGQCSQWLEKMKGVNVVPAGNTAIAAKMVAEASGKDCAAIASPRCAELYGLEILEDKIQDSDNNYTRFICISKDPVRYEGANHISLIVSCANTPGSLYEMLSKPASLGINMIKLESCPIPGRNFEFVFFVELEASVKEPSVLPMIEDLERSCPEIWFLGNYAEI